MEKPRPHVPEATGFTGRGEIYSFTVIYHSPEKFKPFLPYVMALVKLSEGVMVTAQITDVDPDSVYIGMPVEMVTRLLYEDGDRGLRRYGYKFRPPIITT